MLGKKIGSFKKLAKKIKLKNAWLNREVANHEYLLRTYSENECTPCTPIGYFALYVGEERQRFVVPTRYLSHPLFKMLLEKAHNDGNQKNRLVVPCSVAAFQEVVHSGRTGCVGFVDLKPDGLVCSIGVQYKNKEARRASLSRAPKVVERAVCQRNKYINTIHSFSIYKMLGKKIGFVKKLITKKITSHGSEPLHYECLLSRDHDDNRRSCTSTPRGCIALYVGEERRRFVVQTAHLSHPLFQILLEKAAEEFGFDQKDRLVVPCSVDAFLEVVSSVKCNNGKFDLRYLVEEISSNAI
ncbi:hypothetical protein OSB04_021714 [Centaurea solstitialis]|uniref:Uncharacterized protein n=1 Tax=Centaurea solstitialis TaxID=347529 RepID=A0AA38WI05_9ASTR|nr:hypothetical protein OSB04_021714 [Centaurea solstitialis]